ncbi:MAG: helix-turn-helix transcriptional regulator [Candidatus Dojkabacteria bacterium]|nr:helix-turn-helix transcriptional regulator [Candidatus Dojkabacteria bacterium]MDQ7020721.1 helix-turn-helix transcriptional regulator [Candidatus Dojkabacteria bacterium]
MQIHGKIGELILLLMNPDIVGQRIKYFSKRAGISQLDLEVNIEASHGSISRIEKGITNPSKESLLKITQELNLNKLEKDYLFGDTIKPASTEEISKVVEYMKDYMSKKNILAYILDDRSRFIDIS